MIESPPVLAGVPPATLQQWLAQAQGALQALSVGGQPVSVRYAQGNGERMVTYSRTNIGALTAWIGQLRAALGQARARRPIGVSFR